MKHGDIIMVIEKKVQALETVKRGLDTSSNLKWDKIQIETLERSIKKFQRKLGRAESVTESK
jgi:hypothetical protein